MENRDRCVAIAKEMLGLKENDKLPRKIQYWLIGAYNMVEKTGGVLLSRQAISAIIVSVQISEGVERRCKNRK